MESADYNRDAESRRKILEYIDKSMELFGENAKTAIYWRMENEFGLKRDEIPSKPEAFARFLEVMFGHGSKIVVRMTIQKMKQISGFKNLPSDNLAKAIREIVRS